MQYPWRHFGENNTLQRIYTAEIARHSAPKQSQGQAHKSARYKNTRN